MDYLLEHKLVSSNQHGFLKRHSTTTNLLESLNDWTITLSNHRSVSVAYIDFKSAFDCISHAKLLHKLSSYGITGNLWFWIKAFLSNRFQMVRVNSCFSSSCPVVSGVAQGSVLGPLLFNIFINDISDDLDTSTSAKLFADDLKLYTEFTNTTPSNLQSQLNIIQQWASTWQLKISYTKCNILTIGHHKTLPQFNLGSHLLLQATKAQDLDKTIDYDLRFTSHIHSLVTKANQRSSLILRCFLSRDPANLVRAFKVYIRPLVEYASTTWSPSYVTLITLIEKVQKRFTKRVPGCSHLTYADRLHKLKLQSLEHRRHIADLLMCYNILRENNCLNTSNYFIINKNTNLRGHSLKLTVPVAKLNARRYFFSNRVVPIWNSLPSELILSPSVQSFKHKLTHINLNKFLNFPTHYLKTRIP